MRTLIIHFFPGKPHHSTLQENVQKTDENKIEEENKPEKEKEEKEKEKEMEEDDEEIVIKRPKTPLSNRNRRLTIETPEVDLERFRPQRFNLDATNPLVSIITLVNVSRMSPKLLQTQPHIVENQGITMAPSFLRLAS